MKQVYHVTGKYLARYPNGHFTGDVGISTDIKAKDPEKAKLLVAKKATDTYGFVEFKWLTVDIQKRTTSVTG